MENKANQKKKEENRIITPVFRVSFPAVFTPKAPMQGGEPVYSVQMLFPKSMKAELKAMQDLYKKVAADKWPQGLPKNFRSPFNDGDSKELESHKGHFYVNCKSKFQPGLVDQKRQDIIDENDFYAGCFARASISAYAYDKNGNRGVAFSLQNIQKVKDGEKFASRVAAQDEFEVIEGFESDASGDFGDNQSDDDF